MASKYQEIKTNDMVQYLEGILSEDYEAATLRERTAFDEAAKPFSDSLVLFGAGGLGKKTLAGLRKVGIEPLGFTDNNPSLWGNTVDGLLVYSPSEAAIKWGDRATFVVTIWRAAATERMAERIRLLQELGCQTIVPFNLLFWKYPNVFLPYYVIDLPSKMVGYKKEISAIYQACSDDASCREYLAQLSFRYWGNFDLLPDPVSTTIYFPQDLVEQNPVMIIVDCGAYCGDTVDAFLQWSHHNFQSIIAIEPDPLSYSRLMNFKEGLPLSLRHKVKTHMVAVGDRNGKVFFDAQGSLQSCMGFGLQEVDCIKLDDLLTDIHPTMIKMDIEGAELEALTGSREIIKRDRPLLATCVYHYQKHLWQIPELIRSISDGYQIYFRSHQYDGWDLVCYAIPQKKG